MSVCAISANRFRRRLLACLTALTLCLCLASAARGALTQLSSNSGEVRDILRAGSTTLYAATQGGGVFKSTNGGSSWTRLNGLKERYVWRLAGHPSSPQVIYAGTEHGLFRTSDGGATWSRRTCDTVRALAVNPCDPNHVLIGVPGAGAYASTDGGDTFSGSSAGFDSLDVTAIAFDPASCNVVYAGLNSRTGAAWGGVFRSTDWGTTWSDWNNPGGKGALSNEFVTTIAVDGSGTVYAGTFNTGNNLGAIFTQTGGGGWIMRRELYGIETIAADPVQPGRIWAGTRSYGPWESVDFGATWSVRVSSTADPVYSGIHAISISPSAPGSILLGLKGQGLYATSCGGPPWTKSSSGLKADRVRALAASPASSPNTLYMGLDGGGVKRSTDSGATWTAFENGLEVAELEKNLSITHIAASAVNPNTVYAAAHGRGLFSWNGSAWALVSAPPMPNDPYAAFLKPTGLVVDWADDRIVYYSLFEGGEKAYKRSASGTWAALGAGTFSGTGADGLAVYPSGVVMDPEDNLFLFVFLFDQRPYITGNGGTSWTPVQADHQGFMRLTFYRAARDPSDPNVLLASTNKGLFRSDDYGMNWYPVESVSGLGESVLTGLVFSEDGTAWAAGFGGGYYCSRDQGVTWTAVSDPLLGGAIVDIELINGTLYLVTDGSGILRHASPACP